MNLKAVQPYVGIQMNVKDVMSSERYRKVIQARSLVCYWALREAGIRQAELSQCFHISQSSVSIAVNRGL